MTIKERVVLVSGANGGIGAALVRSLLERDAAKVYAGARRPAALETCGLTADKRVVPICLDITETAAVRAAAERCTDVDVVINNAGLNHCLGFLAPDAPERAREEMDVNYFGNLAMCRAFAPVIAARGGGVIAIVSSIIGMVNMPLNGTYCASKAALHSLIQGMRSELAGKGIQVVGIYPGPVDTAMSAAIDMPKALPEQVSATILDGLEQDLEDVFPDAMATAVHEQLLADPKAVERQFGGR